MERGDAKFTDLIDTLVSIREAMLEPRSTELELVKSIKEIRDAMISTPSAPKTALCQDDSAFNRLMQHTVRIAAGQLESLQLRLQAVEIDVRETKEAALKAETSVLVAKKEAERASAAAGEAKLTAQEAKDIAFQAKADLPRGYLVANASADTEDKPEENKEGREETTMDQIRRLALEAKDIANGAQNAAEEAQSTVKEALAVAKEAQIFSVEASLSAEEAHTTAKEAVDAAKAAHISAEKAYNATEEVHSTAMEAMTSSQEVKDAIEEAKTIARTTLRRITEEIERTKSGDLGFREGNEIEDVKEIAGEAKERAQRAERMCEESLSEVEERTRRVEGLFENLAVEMEGRFIRSEETCEEIRGEVEYRVRKAEEAFEKVKGEVVEAKALANSAKGESQDLRKTATEAKGVAELAKKTALTAKETAKKAEKDAHQALLVTQEIETNIQRVEAKAKASESLARKAKLTALKAEASGRRAEITASKAETVAKRLEEMAVSRVENTSLPGPRPTSWEGPPWPDYDYHYGGTYKVPEYEYDPLFEEPHTTRDPLLPTEAPVSTLATQKPTSGSSGCLPPFSRIGTECMDVSKLYRNWTEARLICQSLWGDLIVHRTTVPLQELLLAHGVYAVWLGAFLDADEGHFYWLDDERVTLEPEVSSLPEGKPICLSLVWDGQEWYYKAQLCSDQLHYVCQAQLDSK